MFEYRTSSSLAVLVLIAAVIISGTPVTAQKPAMKFCYVCQVPSFCMMALYGVRTHYAPAYPNIDWSIKLLGKDGNTQSRDALQAVTTNGTDCDIFIGPGSSSYSKLLSSAVTKPWVDFASTSTDLSNKALYPTFSRIIPTDEIGSKSIVAIMREYEWNSAFLLCTNEAYGESLEAAMRTTIASVGAVSETRCLRTDADEATVGAALEEIRNSRFKIVAVLMPGWSDAYVNLEKYINRTRMNDTHVFLFGESICSGIGPTVVHGSFCTTFGYDFASFKSFYTDFMASNIAAFKPEVEDVGLEYSVPKAPEDIEYSSFVYDAFNMDQIIHPMAVFNAAQAAGTFNKADFNGSIALLRSQASEGFSGPIHLDSNGDRTSTLTDLSTISPEGIRRYGNWTEDYGYRLNPALGVSPYVPLATIKDTDDCRIFNCEKEDKSISPLVVGIAVPIAILVILAIAVLIVMCSVSTTEKFAPVDPREPFGMMALDIEKSTKLWDSYPDIMSATIEQYNQIVRQVIADHPVHEANTQGDSFTIVCTEPGPLLRMAAEIQRKLFAAKWPGDGLIESVYRSTMFGEYSDNNGAVAYEEMWNGPRVRCAIHYGTGTITKRGGPFQYGGGVLDITKEMEAICQGGQVLVSDTVLENVPSDMRNLSEPFGDVHDSEGNLGLAVHQTYNFPVVGLSGRHFIFKAKSKTPVVQLATSRTPSTMNPLTKSVTPLLSNSAFGDTNGDSTHPDETVDEGDMTIESIRNSRAQSSSISGGTQSSPTGQLSPGHPI